MTKEYCPHCAQPPSAQQYRLKSCVLTRQQAVELMQASGDSAADFFEAVATYFAIEEAEIEAN